MYRLTDEIVFPDPRGSDDDGLVAVGGNLDPERLLLGYRMGIFPWYHDGLPILWHSPDPRMVLETQDMHIGRSLKKMLRKSTFDTRMDTCFDDVIHHCSISDRGKQKGTWITEEMKDAYSTLHDQGFGHSVEVFDQERLVGGLYGVSLGSIFFGESMFSLLPNASKFAFVRLVDWLHQKGITLIDCQVHTDYLESFGAREISREDYLERLGEALLVPTLRGRWSF